MGSALRCLVAGLPRCCGVLPLPTVRCNTGRSFGSFLCLEWGLRVGVPQHAIPGVEFLASPDFAMLRPLCVMAIGTVVVRGESTYQTFIGPRIPGA